MKRVFLFFFLLSGFLFSHKINVFTYKEGNKIFVEGYFSDGKPVKNSPIEVYNSKEEKIIEGKTDENGIFSFDIPDTPKIKIVLIADSGHRAETFMEIEKEEKIEKKVEKKEEKPKEIRKEEIKGMDEEEMKKIVEEVIEKKMNDFLREYRKDKEKEKFKDITGGIGYIFGIIGIYLYFKGRSLWKK